MHTNAASSELFDNLRLELRRGCLVVAVLAQLYTEHYGYALRKALGDQGLAIDENTLYPLLRRLESQGLLVSQWREEEKRNKRFYRLSPLGEEVLPDLLEEWRQMTAALEGILGGRGVAGDAPRPGADFRRPGYRQRCRMRRPTQGGKVVMPTTNTDLIDRYLHAVKFWLPKAIPRSEEHTS